MGKATAKKKKRVEYGIHSMALDSSPKRNRSPGSDKNDWRKEMLKLIHFLIVKIIKAVTNGVVVEIRLGIVVMWNVLIVMA